MRIPFSFPLFLSSASVSESHNRREVGARTQTLRTPKTAQGRSHIRAVLPLMLRTCSVCASERPQGSHRHPSGGAPASHWTYVQERAHGRQGPEKDWVGWLQPDLHGPHGLGGEPVGAKGRVPSTEAWSYPRDTETQAWALGPLSPLPTHTLLVPDTNTKKWLRRKGRWNLAPGRAEAHDPGRHSCLAALQVCKLQVCKALLTLAAPGPGRASGPWFEGSCGPHGRKHGKHHTLKPKAP